MNYEHEMLMDTLKGHKRKVTYWQYQDVRQQMDNELYYIVCTCGDIFREKLKSPDRTYFLKDLFFDIGEACYKTIAEREELTIQTRWANDDVKRIRDFMLRATTNFTGTRPESIQSNIDTFWVYAVDAAIAIVRYRKL
jgi:hypothetical protein